MSDGTASIRDREAVQKWELVNPEGVIQVDPRKVNAHPAALAGRTIVLRANGKHNSDRFLQRVAELLAENVQKLKIVKLWETAAPETFTISQNPDISNRFAEKIASFKPDLVIASQGD